MADRILAHLAGNTVANLIVAPAGWVPPVGETYVEVTNHAPGPQIGWTTPDGGQTFDAPSEPQLTQAQLSDYASDAWEAFLGRGQIFNVAAAGATAVPVLCDGTNNTRADLALLALYGQDNPAGTKTWLDNTGKTSVLTGAQLVTLATLAGNWIADSYPALARLIAEIQAGTVTTTAAIDAAFAAVTA